MTGCGPVDDDVVVPTAALELLDLAEHDQVVDARAGRRDDVDDAARPQARRDRPQPVVVEVLRERRGGIEVHDLETGEELLERRLAVEFDDQHLPTRTGCRSRQNSGYRGLPDAPLAGHDGHAGVGDELQWIFRRHSCAD